MKRFTVLIFLLSSMVATMQAIEQANCPFFGGIPSWGNVVYYNLNAEPWNFELHLMGDTAGATVQWYTYQYGQSLKDTIPYHGKGSNTVDQCYPTTDSTALGKTINYVCVVKTPSCPQGIIYQDASATVNGECSTIGSTHTLTSTKVTYTEGDMITLTDYYDGYGGWHYYTWYKDGQSIDSTAQHDIWNDPNDFNHSVLTIPAAQLSDGGTYYVYVSDGEDASHRPCYSVSNSVTITVKPKTMDDVLIFDNHNNTGVWSDPKNWAPNYNRVPTTTDSVIIRSACLVDIADAQAGTLCMDTHAHPTLTIAPVGALLVSWLMTNIVAGDIVIQSSAQGIGSLVMAAVNKDIPATMECYALANGMHTGGPSWQYIGYPLQGQAALPTTYPGAMLYEWSDTPNETVGGNWQRVDSIAGYVRPFIGYCLTEDTVTVYSLSGLLNNPQSTDVDIPYHAQGDYPGFCLVANSWSAPIDIALMDVSDFHQADATVYIMNTGSYYEAIAQQSEVSSTGLASARGQYNAIPVHAAPYMSGALTTIPSMQGFFVHTTEATTLTLDYHKTIYAATSHATTPTRAPRRSANNQPAPKVYRFHVSGFGDEDQLYILQSDAFTTGFDNGWDGYKVTSRFSNVHMAVVFDDARLAVAALPRVDGVIFEFHGLQHKTYTLLMECPDSAEPMMIWDVNNDVYTPLSDGGEYRFICGSEPNRFCLVTTRPETNASHSATKYIINGQLFIRCGNNVYDAMGGKQ